MDGTSTDFSFVGVISIVLCAIACQVMCQGEMWPTLDSIRLVGGKEDHEGRVEVLYHGEWGTVCDFDWSDGEAAAVCRQLGYDGGVAKERAFFGEGQGKVWLHEVECQEEDEFLVDCGMKLPTLTGFSCSHNMDVGVICEEKRSSLNIAMGVMSVLIVISFVVLVFFVCLRRQTKRRRRRSTNACTSPGQTQEEEVESSCTDNFRLFGFSSRRRHDSSSFQRGETLHGNSTVLAAPFGGVVTLPPPYSSASYNCQHLPETSEAAEGELPPPYTAQASPHSPEDGTSPVEVRNDHSATIPSTEPPSYNNIYQK